MNKIVSLDDSGIGEEKNVLPDNLQALCQSIKIACERLFINVDEEGMVLYLSDIDDCLIKGNLGSDMNPNHIYSFIKDNLGSNMNPNYIYGLAFTKESKNFHTKIDRDAIKVAKLVKDLTIKNGREFVFGISSVSSLDILQNTGNNQDEMSQLSELNEAGEFMQTYIDENCRWKIKFYDSENNDCASGNEKSGLSKAVLDVFDSQWFDNLSEDDKFRVTEIMTTKHKSNDPLIKNSIIALHVILQRACNNNEKIDVLFAAL